MRAIDQERHGPWGVDDPRDDDLATSRRNQAGLVHGRRCRPTISRLQGDREHLPRSLAHDLIEHRTARLVGLGLVVDYLEHGRTFPTGAPTPAHDQTCYGLSIFLGKVRPFTSPRRGPSTGSDHCSSADGKTYVDLDEAKQV